MHLIKFKILRNIIKNTLYMLLLSVSFINVSLASTTEIQPNNSLINIVSGVDSKLLQISSSSPDGFSFNSFDVFSIYNQDLVQIINHASLNKSLRNGAEADVVSIESNNDINLSGVIELVGRPAELVIATKNGSINCTNCEFKNFSRVTLVTGEIKKTLTGFEIDEILVKNKEIIVSGTEGLKAPGVVFLDLLAGSVKTNADISTNLKALNLGGKITPSETGNLSIATGNTRVTLGAFNYKYLEGEVTSFDLGQNVNFSGNNGPIDIYSGSIRVELLSNSDLLLNQNFITTSDMTMASMYQGKNIIPDESVLLRTAGNIFLESNITSKGEAVFESGADVNFSSYGSNQAYTVTSGSISIATVGDFKNYIELDADEINISANNVENEGLISSSNIAYIRAVKSIRNRFGGFIDASEILMQAGTTFINGSERAYRLVKEPVLFMAKSAVIIDVGTYIDFDVDPEGYMREEVDSLKAYIIADKIEIKAGSFKNINPLHQMMTINSPEMSLYDEEIELEIDRVTIHAEDTLTILSDEAILNSSAVLETNTGKIALFTPHLINERYHIQIIEKPGSVFNTGLCLTTNACTTAANQTLSDDTLEKFISYYSPAGRIYSGSDAILSPSTAAIPSDDETPRSSFVNDMSFIEIFGDFNVEVDNVLQTGLSLQAEVSLNVSTTHSRRYCARSVFGKCLRKKTRYWVTNAPSYHLVETGILPALFLVEGFLQGTGSGDFELNTTVL